MKYTKEFVPNIMLPAKVYIYQSLTDMKHEMLLSGILMKLATGLISFPVFIMKWYFNTKFSVRYAKSGIILVLNRIKSLAEDN